MRPRHRIPSIFNLYMLDVMCGALGAVVILWMYKEDQAKTLAASEQQLSAIEKELRHLLDAEQAKAAKLSESEKKLLADLAVLRTARDKLSDSEKKLLAELATMQSARDKLSLSEKDLTTRLNDLLKVEANLRRLLASVQEDDRTNRKKIDTLTAQLGDLTKDRTGLESTLALRKKDIDELEKKLAALLKDNQKLDTDLKSMSSDRKTEAERLSKLIAMLNDKLKMAELGMSNEEAKIKTLRADLETLSKTKSSLEKELTDSEKKRADLQGLLGERVSDLLKANKSLEELKTEKDKLLADIARLRVILDQRFAGIELTGKRVIFLVDMSGSMDLVDEKTPAVNKWAGVRSTLAQLMKSLPNLEKFQVIVFSEDSTHLLGKPSEWLDYDPKTSPERVRAELAKIKPRGGTNMYRPLDMAFRYRSEGLDTIYLFSDGLPNEGEGLTPEQARLTDETVKSNLLGRYIRRKLQSDWNRPIVGRERVRINGVGFFYESPDVGAFLWALSRENEGSFVGMSKP